MNITERLIELQHRARKNASEVIFPFWTSDMLLNDENDGFYGKVTLDMEIIKDEPMSLVLLGRMAYSFSRAYLVLGDQIYLDRAKRAFDHLMRDFYDRTHRGAYSKVSVSREILDDTKPAYGEAFFIMAAAGYYQATKDQEAYRVGMELFDIMESKYKLGKASYKTSLNRDFSKTVDMKFGNKKMTLPPGTVMFQHHLCQAYEQLFLATGEQRVGSSLHEFAVYIADTLFDPEYNCFKGVLDQNGNRIGTRQSYGHDCEISYLALDIAELTEDKQLIEKMKGVCIKVLSKVLENNFDIYGSLISGGDLTSAVHDNTRTWWVQAEAVMGMLCGYQLTGNVKFIDACERVFDYIEKYFVNKKNGDWYNNIVVDESGVHIVDGMHGFDKVNAGKCPFHNSHMCFDVIRRVDNISKGGN